MKCKYAYKALTELAKNYKKGTLQTVQIAEAQNIPKKFLEQILIELKKGGYANSKQGAGGGYYIMKDPAKITLAEIYRMFEGAIAMLPCVSEKFYEKCDDCDDEATCGLKVAFAEIRDQTYELLSNQTVQTLLDNEKKLRRKKKFYSSGRIYRFEVKSRL